MLAPTVDSNKINAEAIVGCRLRRPLPSLLSPAFLPKATVAAEAWRQCLGGGQLGGGGGSLAIARRWRQRRLRQQQVAAIAFVSIVIVVGVIVAVSVAAAVATFS